MHCVSHGNGTPGSLGSFRRAARTMQGVQSIPVTFTPQMVETNLLREGFKGTGGPRKVMG